MRVVRHQDFLYRLAVWATGDSMLAEDALQDGLLRAFDRARLYRGEGPVRAWLARIVLNACRDAQRWQRRRRLEPLPSAEALGRLGFDQRIALVPYAVHGLDYEEIVLATAAPMGTVKSRIHRARLALRTLVAEHRDLFVDS